MHVGNLDGVGVSVNRKNWSASVTIYVHDSTEALVTGVSVTGSWGSGVSGSTSCTTDGSGSCTLTTSNINTKISSAVFSVQDLATSGYVYEPGSNHDWTGDSDGTSLTIPSP